MDLRDFTSSSVDWEKHIPRNAECFGEGDSYLILDVLPQDLVSDVFRCICKEVKWESMSHRGMSLGTYLQTQISQINEC